ncbi:MULTISPECIES: hypothetical protein [unclassified Streptomyces]|uniref:hypothetical protein n=1 Tax=Streptomyces sp. NPDC055082 TaxID=3365718 RepID=UPI0037CD97E5
MKTHNIPGVENIPVEVHRLGLGWFPEETVVTITPTRATHAPFVRSRIKRYMAAGYAVTGGFRGTEYVSAALRLSSHLPDAFAGQWGFNDVELNMLKIVMLWGKYENDLPENLAMRQAICTAHAVRHFK